MEIGAQLYTVRDYCKTLEDFEETLKKIADIGYVNVQVSGSCAFAPEWLDEKLKANGLRCVVTHVPADRLVTEPEQVAKDMAVIGEGNINFERVFAAAEKAGTKYMLVEQDDCNGEDPFACLKRSYEYLKACGF